TEAAQHGAPRGRGDRLRHPHGDLPVLPGAQVLGAHPAARRRAEGVSMAPATTWKKGDPLPPKLKHEPFPYCLDCKDPTTPPVAAEASGDPTVTRTGALAGDFILCSTESAAWDTLNTPAPTAYCSAADTVRVRVTNNNVAAGAAIDVASSTMQFHALRRTRLGPAGT